MTVFVGSQSSTYVLSNNDRHVVTGDILVANAVGIYVASECDLTVLARVSSGGTLTDGLSIAASNVSVQIGQSAYVGGNDNGIYIGSIYPGTRILNLGFITTQGTFTDADHSAVYSASALYLENHGTLAAQADGTLSSAIRLTGFNADTIVNFGEIHGNVVLGDGSDTFWQRGGAVSGTVDGGGGFDAYHIEAGTLDIIEADLGGYDSVYSAVNFTLPDYVEALYLQGSANINGFGSAQGNSLIGNAADNILAGRGGDDFLYASEGDDILRGGAGTDAILLNNTMFNRGVTLSLALQGAQAFDATSGSTLRVAGIEDIGGSPGADRLTGSAGANDITGNTGADQIHGGGGNDRLEGGAGPDRLWGDAGADLFNFNSIADANRDSIVDFVHGLDTISLDAIDANATAAGQQDFTFIGTKAFTGAAGQLHYIAAKGWLEGDTDGDKAADFHIVLQNMPDLLTASDFIF